MALQTKKVAPKVKEVKVEVCNCKEAIQALNEKILLLEDRLAFVETRVVTPEVRKVSINRVEKFNDEAPSTIESYNGLKMEESDKIISMQNAIKILPPNMIINGRHAKENVEAICGFKIDDWQMDKAYEGITHEP